MRPLDLTDIVAVTRYRDEVIELGNRVFFGSHDGNLYGLNLEDGKQVFKFLDGSAFSASPAVGRNRLVIGSESTKGFIYCFGAKRKGR